VSVEHQFFFRWQGAYLRLGCRYQLNLAGMQLPKKVECGIQLPAQSQRVDGSPALLHVGLLLSAEDGAAEHAAQWCLRVIVVLGHFGPITLLGDELEDRLPAIDVGSDNGVRSLQLG
jgi:hypothetical protein